MGAQHSRHHRTSFSYWLTCIQSSVNLVFFENLGDQLLNARHSCRSSNDFDWVNVGDFQSLDLFFEGRKRVFKLVKNGLNELFVLFSLQQFGEIDIFHEILKVDGGLWVCRQDFSLLFNRIKKSEHCFFIFHRV